MLFLRTLPKQYGDFITHKKLQEADTLCNTAVLYEAATAWRANVDGATDEANTSGKALFGGGTKRATEQQDDGDRHSSKRRARAKCYNCGQTGHYKLECTVLLWLDWATIRFRFIGHCRTCTGSFCVFGPVLSSPAHAASSLDMPPIGIKIF
jgi:hypothetical protein